jgi:hypothetical protein
MKEDEDLERIILHRNRFSDGRDKYGSNRIL